MLNNDEHQDDRHHHHRIKIIIMTTGATFGVFAFHQSIESDDYVCILLHIYWYMYTVRYGWYGTRFTHDYIIFFLAVREKRKKYMNHDFLIF